MAELIFGRPYDRPRAVWNATDFVAIDDQVRGGSSTSAMKVVTQPVLGSSNNSDSDAGAIDFTGFLDTTTLGGAGFASQAYPHPFPGATLQFDHFRGLSLVVRALQKLDSRPSDAAGSTLSSSSKYPGGGKTPVRSYVLNLKTTKAKQRPDGRRESQLTYEFKFDVPDDAKDAPGSQTLEICSHWGEFKPTYRGRPSEDAPPLDPAKIQGWSIMARSDFGSQSGPFALRLVSLGAIPRGPQRVEKRTLFRDQLADGRPPPLTASSQQDVASNTSSEYYGFALYIFATVLFVVWIVWALTPDRMLKSLGIDWYPNREWAFLLPAWSLFAVLFTYAGFMTLNIRNNPRLDDLSQVVDSHSNVLPLGHEAEMAGLTGDTEKHPLCGRDMASTGGLNGPMAADIYDLPPGFVSRERHGL